jgi:hypothetical protein
VRRTRPRAALRRQQIAAPAPARVAAGGGSVTRTCRPTAYLSEVERGRKEASSEVLAAVCAALGIRLVDLVARTGAELRPAAPVRALPGVRRAAPGRGTVVLAA